ncbi:MAG: hypothetical protein A2Y15_04445 [Clostridiales bacterium GWF2_36_10]|nr:MAG: hypothetical protein A2Y15_04445 [Clostridiales bacterium GWF2_36_10]HAN20661.1 hypothetical protein [Clostridiales bacterium]
MISLDTRLFCIYNAVGTCNCLADIGSDHALLPIALLQSEKVKHAIASDINTGPIEQSRKNAIRYNISNIDFLLSNGFDSIEKGSFDKAAICGMGGTLIANIIRRGGIKAHCDLILQPMTAYEDLRSYLWDNGFSINNEIFAADSKKPYVIINAQYTSEFENYTYSDLYLGKIRPDTVEYRLFCKKVCYQTKKRLEGALHLGLPTDELEKLITDCN